MGRVTTLQETELAPLKISQIVYGKVGSAFCVIVHLEGIHYNGTAMP